MSNLEGFEFALDNEDHVWSDLECRRVKEFIINHTDFTSHFPGGKCEVTIRGTKKDQPIRTNALYRLNFISHDDSVCLSFTLSRINTPNFILGVYNCTQFTITTPVVYRGQVMSSVIDYAIIQLVALINTMVDHEIEAVSEALSGQEMGWHREAKDNLAELWRFKLGV